MDYSYKNLIVTRTFSKDYGLAGLRVGCAVGPKPLIGALYKVKLPFEPNTLAQYAVIAALEDTDYLKKSIAMALLSLQRMVKLFKQLGISFVKPTTNFIMMTFPSESFAKVFHDECLNQGLILRHLTPFGIPEGVRINAGTPNETTFALDIIQKIYKKIV